jgi:rubrerythrin
MRGLLSRWLLSSVLRSAMAFETEAIDAYRGLRAGLLAKGACHDSLESSICHLLEEAEAHRRLLEDAAAGRVGLSDLERMLEGHLYPGYDAIRPLEGEDRAHWEAALAAALAREEKTWLFYGNLRRMSTLPLVRRVFEVLAGMEREHVDILRKLLGLPTTREPAAGKG